MRVLTAVDRDAIAELHARDEFFWLDLVAPGSDELELAGELLGLHPVALEDTLRFGQQPKLDRYEDHVMLVFFTARTAGEAVEPVEVHVYISGSFLITIRRDPGLGLEDLHDVLVPAGTEEEDYLVYRVLNALAEGFYPVIDAIEARVDALEGEVLARARREHLTGIYRLKQDVHALYRRASAQADRFRAGTATILDLPGLRRGSRPYLNDVSDHLDQVSGELDRQAEDLNALTSTYFNANANRLTAIATRLTVVATFFLVWTLVTGFFGQNFGWLVDNISTQRDFLLLEAAALAVPTVVLAAVFWLKRHDWF